MSTKQVIALSFIIMMLAGAAIPATALDGEHREGPHEGPTGETVTVDGVSAIKKDTRQIDVAKHNKIGKAESEAFNIKVKTLPKISGADKSLIKRNDVPREKIEKLGDITSPLKARCTSAETDYILPYTFDCGAIASVESQANLYASRRDPAIVEVTLHLDNIEEPVVVLEDERQYWTQQVSLYYFDEKTEVWRALCHDANECALGEVAEGANEIQIRAEGYSPEGGDRKSAIWSVKGIHLREARDVKESHNKPEGPASDLRDKKPGNSGHGNGRPDEFDRRKVDLMPGQPGPTPPGSTPPVPPPINTKSGFSSSGVEVSSGADTGVVASEDTSEVITPNTGNNEPIAVPRQEEQGLLALTGAAITDLATQNMAGLLLILAILGLLGYKGYGFVRKRRV